MGTEIERKFLVTNDSWREGAASIAIRQGYLAVGPPVSVRVRVAGDKATFNIKQSTLEISRAEFEYPLPLDDAHELLGQFCGGRCVEKTRYFVEHKGLTWEVDVFAAENAGLIVAEIELDTTSQSFAIPGWVGEEVSGDPRYLNSSLTRYPFSQWNS